jgi:uncharacterized protein
VKKLFFILFVLGAIVLFFNQGKEDCRFVEFEQKTIMVGTNQLKIFISENQCQLEKGLMNVKSLSNDGMLFVLPTEMKAAFWMRNTYIDLSIAFIDSDGMILEIKNMSSIDWEQRYFSESDKVKYALEVEKGLFDKLNIKVGDKLLL